MRVYSGSSPPPSEIATAGASALAISRASACEISMVSVSPRLAEPVLVAQIVEGIAGADLIGLLAEQLQATAHRHPLIEGAPQRDRGQTRGIEDAALIGGGFEFDNVAPTLLNGRPFPNVYRRQRKADGFLGTWWNPIGEMLGFHGVFQAP
jgi:hypothetical protein